MEPDEKYLKKIINSNTEYDSDNSSNMSDYLIESLVSDTDSVDSIKKQKNFLSNLDSEVESIDISNMEISGRIDLGKFTQLKYLNCSNNYITDIVNIPKSIIDLDCSKNTLTKLANLPDTIKNLDCSCNRIEELKDLPSTIQTLNCGFNSIYEFHIPKSVKILDISHNKLSELSLDSTYKNLIKLDCSENIIKNLGKLPDSLKWLDCSYNHLEKIKKLPENLVYFKCTYNRFREIKFNDKLKYLNCSNNFLDSFKNIPESLEVLIVVENKLEKLSGLPKSLIELNCANNEISSIHFTSDLVNLKKINLNHNHVKTIEVYPPNLEIANIIGCELSHIDNLPSTLKILICESNNISNFDSLPNGLIKLECRDNPVSKLNNLPRTLQILKCLNCNNLSELNNLPESLLALDCSENPLLTEIKVLPNGLKYLDFGFRASRYRGSEDDISKNKLVDTTFANIKFIPESLEQLNVYISNDNYDEELADIKKRYPHIKYINR